MVGSVLFKLVTFFQQQVDTVLDFSALCGRLIPGIEAVCSKRIRAGVEQSIDARGHGSATRTGRSISCEGVRPKARL